MKKIIPSFMFLFLLITPLAFIQEIEAKPIQLQPIVVDNFNIYTSGSIVGQGSWGSYANGENFIIQDNVSFKRGKALYNNSLTDSVISKAGTPLADGRQAIYVRTENRTDWGSYPNGNVQVRILKGGWGGSELRNFIAVSLKSNGNVAYYDSVNDIYQDFATYIDNEWTLLQFEWRSADMKARFKVNRSAWTDWKPFAGSSSFSNFDNVGFDFFLPSGSGGVYFDSLN